MLPPRGRRGRRSVTRRPMPNRSAAPAHRLVLVNGRFAPELSRHRRPAVRRVRSARWPRRCASGRTWRAAARYCGRRRTAHQPFAALNAAFFADGFVLDVAPGVALDRPSRSSISASAPTPPARCTPAQPRRAGRRQPRRPWSRPSPASGDYWRNDVVDCELAAGRDAAPRHADRGRAARRACISASSRRRWRGGAAMTSFVARRSAARLSRHEVDVAMRGRGARSALSTAPICCAAARRRPSPPRSTTPRRAARPARSSRASSTSARTAFSRADHGAPGRAEDRRAPDQPQSAAVGRAPRSTPSPSSRSTPTT